MPAIVKMRREMYFSGRGPGEPGPYKAFGAGAAGRIRFTIGVSAAVLCR